MAKRKETVAATISRAIHKSGKTNREIAAEVGFPRPNFISMLKSGATRVPLGRVHRLALAIDLDPAELLEQAFREYDAELWESIETLLLN